MMLTTTQINLLGRLLGNLSVHVEIAENSKLGFRFLPAERLAMTMLARRELIKFVTSGPKPRKRRTKAQIAAAMASADLPDDLRPRAEAVLTHAGIRAYQKYVRANPRGGAPIRRGAWMLHMEQSHV